MEFLDIEKSLTDGQNMPGLSQAIYFGKWEDVQTWPTEPLAPADIEANGGLTGSLVMKTGTRMFEFYSSEDAADLVFNPAGENESRYHEMVLTVFHPGLRKKILGFMNAVKNDRLVIVVQDSEGNKYLLGSEFRAARYTGGDGSGTGADSAGKRGIGMQFTYKAKGIYLYEGDIPLTPSA